MIWFALVFLAALVAIGLLVYSVMHDPSPQDRHEEQTMNITDLPEQTYVHRCPPECEAQGEIVPVRSVVYGSWYTPGPVPYCIYTHLALALANQGAPAAGADERDPLSVDRPLPPGAVTKPMGQAGA